MPPARREVIEAIKRLGEPSIVQLAAAVGISVSGVRKLVVILKSAGLVDDFDWRVPGAPGRAQKRYRLTRKGHELFPTRSFQLARELIRVLTNENTEPVAAYFRQLGQEMLASALERDGESPAGALRALCSVLNEYDYMGTVEERPGILELRFNHCPVRDVAEMVPVLCDIELETIVGAVPGCDVARTQHLLSGDALCVYRVCAGPQAP